MKPSARPDARRLATVVSALCLGILVAAALLELASLSSRPLNWDEGEYLHVAWLIGSGKRLYRDFLEHHSPHLSALLLVLEPSATTAEYPLLDTPLWIQRARAVIGATGLAGALAAGAVAARMTGRLSAAVVTLAALLAGKWTFLRGIADARNDPPTLAMLWIAILLLVWRRDASRAATARAGTALGLLVVVCSWNPKWPLECLALAAFAVGQVAARGRQDPRGAAALGGVPVAVLTSLTLVVITRFATLRDYVFYTYQLSATISRRVVDEPGLIEWFRDKAPLFYCSPIFHPAAVLVATAIVAASLGAARARWRDPAGVALVVGVVVLAGVEVLILTNRFRWPQAFLSWSYAGAVAYACAGDALLKWTRRVGDVADTLVSIACAVLGVVATTHRELPAEPERWTLQRWLQHNIRPGDRVWVRADCHPIAAEDASYYWFSTMDVAPAVMAYANASPDNAFVPPQKDGDLPVCRALDGRDPSVWLLPGRDQLASFPRERECFGELVRHHRLEATPYAGTFAVVRAPPP